MKETGTVKWFNAGKGFGFIQRENGEDVSSIFRRLPRLVCSLDEGARVSFIVKKGPKGFAGGRSQPVKTLNFKMRQAGVALLPHFSLFARSNVRPIAADVPLLVGSQSPGKHQRRRLSNPSASMWDRRFRLSIRPSRRFFRRPAYSGDPATKATSFSAAPQTIAGGVVGGPVVFPSSTTSPNLIVDRPSYRLYS